MSWAKEQILRAAYKVFDDMMRNAFTDVQKIRCQNLYYEIQKYKVTRST